MKRKVLQREIKLLPVKGELARQAGDLGRNELKRLVDCGPTFLELSRRSSLVSCSAVARC